MDNTAEIDPLDALTAAYQAEAQAQNAALLARLERAGRKKDQASLRQQGLSTSLIPKQQHAVEPSKGLALLKKMGYQEGKGLGAQLQGLSEPLPLVIRSKRSGLGIHEAKAQQQQQAEEREMQEKVKRQRLAQETAGQYAQRVKSEFKLRKLLQQLKEAWQAAESLEERSHESRVDAAHDDVYAVKPNDIAHGSSSSAGQDSLHQGGTHSDMIYVSQSECLNMLLAPRPVLQQLLAQQCPSATQQDNTQHDEAKNMSTLTGDKQHGHHTAAEVDVSKLDPDVVESELQVLLTFLRDRHRYCLFCGHAYDNQEQLRGSCPGQFEADHE